jgi:hypothetical protein
MRCLVYLLYEAKTHRGNRCAKGLLQPQLDIYSGW